jgi:hypothetical protein
MIADGRFSRLSPPYGKRIAAGSVRITVDGVFAGYGTTPVWLNDYVVLYARQPDPNRPNAYPDNGLLMAYNAISAETVSVGIANFTPDSLCTDLNGHWAVEQSRTIITSEGRRVEGAFRPTWAGSDLCWCVDTGTTADLYREGKLIARTVHDVRGEPDGRLCFIQVNGATQWTCIHHPDGHIDAWRLNGAEEYHPHVVRLQGEDWVFSHTRDDRLLLRTGSNGIVIHHGVTFEPDCAFDPAMGILRVVWADAYGRLVQRELVPLTRTTFGMRGDGLVGHDVLTVGDLRPVPGPVAAPWPPGIGWKVRPDITEVDIVEFLLGSRDWSRNGMHVSGDAVTYTHPFQSRRVGNNAVQHSKFGPPDVRSATWTYDEKYVGLAYDGTNALGENGLTGYCYTNPGSRETAALYPRVMKVGKEYARTTTLDILDLNTGKPNRVTWRGYVDAVYENLVPIGDIPAGTLHAIIIFEPQPDNPATWREKNICAQHVGSWYWDATKVRTEQVEERWIATKNASRFADLPVQFADKLPVAQEEPMPPSVKIVEYAKSLQANVNARVVRVQNQNASDEVIVDLENNSIHVEWKNNGGSNRSGLRREVTIGGSASTPDPDPPKPDPPKPTPNPTRVTLKTSHGTFLRAMPDGSVVQGADGESGTSWLPVREGATLSLQAEDGRYLRITNDAGHVAATGQAIDVDERFTITVSGSGITLQARNGRYVCAEIGGGVVADREVVGSWEIWSPSTPLFSSSPRSGALRIASDGKSYADDKGRYLPVIMHAGDLLSRVIRGLRGDESHLAFVNESLDVMAAYEYDGARTWVATYGPQEGTFWWQRDVNPNDPLLDAAVLWYCHALKARGLGWLVSMGDVSMLISPLSERMAFARRIARLIASVDPSLVLGVDGGNEAWQTGEPDPSRLRQIVQAFREIIPCDVWSCTSGESERKDHVDLYAGSVADRHGWRDGETWDKIRHIFSPMVEGVYDAYLLIDSEMFGYGRNVSATDEHSMRTMTANTIRMAVVQSLASRQIPVVMSSVGVISDGMVERLGGGRFRPIFDGGERFADIMGIDSAKVARKLVPNDIMAWPTRCHGGAGQTGRRVRAVPALDETRADQAFSSDGRVFSVEYGPRWRECFSEKSFNIEVEHYFDAEGRVLYGRR